MPEGPELHLASHFVNEACRELVFGGCVEKSPVSRNPEVPFESSAYSISALARGKELRLTLSPLPGAQPPREPLALVFRFGMTGSFQLVPSDALPPHAHLRFYTAPPGPQLALCFVDIRRFGRWDLGGEWQPGRGPCVLLEYEQFRENVLRNLADKAFDRPICEALLDQRFFNGIGNYLRAEILYRLRIPPFEKARTVLEALQQRRPVRALGGMHLHLSEPRADPEPEDQGQAAEPRPAGAVPLGAQGSGPAGGILDPWHPKGASPARRRSPREHSRVLRTEWRTLHLQTRPLQGHEGHREAFLNRLQPRCQRGPASNGTQKPPQSLTKGRGGGDQQPQAATEPERSRLTPHPWSLRGPQPPSKRLFLFVSTPPPGTLDLGLCGFLEVAGNWMLRPYGHFLRNYVFNCIPLSSFFKPM
ncbi:endonuclease 8-like 1 isoform X1 [Moschus berezovskii]|uniref:endonuclease 8-like 1 isoform X1 n=1 Tax=Moschus berezovskii TaxID=68408 RepID=UPI002444AC07|nr:endonuclease 8-like 1 isoform X1 [Moschus berezovskii]XP_055274094.1 endonuclease 8-like 1 isoform X1 [Moschus berezovskii]XP_055274095.1 endonuclease 8-like 1 isoform X1 [Moschus berezovskii]XP_055274097.1 endonuclease 8-like 1 isoform X1 [Moschus berezovskii]XP_055274098.1 endonuclease 8-like 1 isoform X1 [Moschus berezovskii]